MSQNDYGPMAVYRLSKLANVMFSKELGKRLQGKACAVFIYDKLNVGYVTVTFASQ